MRLVLALIVLLLAPAAALAQEPLGVVDHALARFARDTLQPVGPTIPLPEPHTAPVMAPGAERFAIGVSSPGTPDLPGQGRVGLWVVDAATMTVQHQIRAGIAAEAVVFPGMIAAVLQDGALLVVDPADGRIVSRRQVGYSFSAPDGEHVAGYGVIVNEIRRGRGAEVVVVDARGRVRTTFIRLPGISRDVALATSEDRAYIVANRRIAVLDPVTLTVTTRRFDGSGATAAFTRGALAIGGPRGLRIYDTRTWRLRARDARSTEVYASGSTFIASGHNRVSAYSTAGRRLWSASGNAAAVAAGRVYAQPHVLDAATGKRVGTHPDSLYPLRVIDP